MPDRFVTGADGFAYDPAGNLRMPKFGDGAIGTVSAIFGFIYPFVVMRDKWDSPFSLGLLKDTTLFKVLATKRFLSSTQIDNAEFFLFVMLLLGALGIPGYLRKNLRKYSVLPSLPIQLKNSWLSQLRYMTVFALVFGLAPFVLGKLVYWGAPVDFLGSGSMFPILIVLSTGAYFIVEVTAGALLWSCFTYGLWKVP